MLSAIIIKIILAHAIVSVTDYAGCKPKIFSKSYCATAFLKYKIQTKPIKKVIKVIKKKKKQKCKWYKAC